MRVLIFGATGSIGSQTITVLKQIKYQLVGISFYNNIKKAKQIKCKYRYTPLYKNESNVKNYEELINKSKPDMIVNAVSGIAGLEITLLSIKHHIDIALANKESLVVAGKFVTKLAKKNKVNIYPIDSEHASLLQILKQIKDKPIELAITASGGKYYNKSNNELKNISYKNAIKHPT
jgi:1-deoxy-D-xylulose-5-phosphate reductoisomerase